MFFFSELLWPVWVQKVCVNNVTETCRQGRKVLQPDPNQCQFRVVKRKKKKTRVPFIGFLFSLEPRNMTCGCFFFSVCSFHVFLLWLFSERDPVPKEAKFLTYCAVLFLIFYDKLLLKHFFILQGEKVVWAVNRNRGDNWVWRHVTIFSKRPYRVSSAIGCAVWEV